VTKVNNFWGIEMNDFRKGLRQLLTLYRTYHDADGANPYYQGAIDTLLNILELYYICFPDANILEETENVEIE